MLLSTRKAAYEVWPCAWSSGVSSSALVAWPRSRTGCPSSGQRCGAVAEESRQYRGGSAGGREAAPRWAGADLCSAAELGQEVEEAAGGSWAAGRAEEEFGEFGHVEVIELARQWGLMYDLI